MAEFSFDNVGDSLKGMFTGNKKWYWLGGLGIVVLLVIFANKSGGSNGTTYVPGYGDSEQSGSVGGNGAGGTLDLSGISADFTNQVTSLANSFTESMNNQSASFTAALGQQSSLFQSQFQTMTEQQGKQAADFALALGSMQQSTSEQFNNMNNAYLEKFNQMAETNNSLANQIGGLSNSFADSLSNFQNIFSQQMNDLSNKNAALEQQITQQGQSLEQKLQQQAADLANKYSGLNSGYTDHSNSTNYNSGTTSGTVSQPDRYDSSNSPFNNDKIAQAVQDARDKNGVVPGTSLPQAPSGWVDPGWTKKP